MIASFDLGLHLGWAITQGGVRLDSGVWHLKGKNWESRGVSYLRAGKHINNLFEQYPSIELVTWETVKRFMSSDAAITYGALAGQLMVACELANHEYIGYSPTEIKKVCTGKGNASKEEMIAAALRIYGHTCESDEADALCTGYTADKHLG